MNLIIDFSSVNLRQSLIRRKLFNIKKVLGCYESITQFFLVFKILSKFLFQIVLLELFLIIKMFKIEYLNWFRMKKFISFKV